MCFELLVAPHEARRAGHPVSKATLFGGTQQGAIGSWGLTIFVSANGTNINIDLQWLPWLGNVLENTGGFQRQGNSLWWAMAGCPCQGMVQSTVANDFCVMELKQFPGRNTITLPFASNGQNVSKRVVSRCFTMFQCSHGRTMKILGPPMCFCDSEVAGLTPWYFNLAVENGDL